MNKKGLSKLVAFLIILCLILVAIIIILLFFIFGGKDYSLNYEEKFASGELVNPIENLSFEQAIQEFDAGFVLYILYSIKAYNLHTSPFSSDKPKIEFNIDEEIYNAVVNSGEIIVGDGGIEEEDIVVITTKEEGVKMLQNKNYIEESFQSGKSTFEIVAGKTELASKGYLEIYSTLTGKTITGFIIGDF